MSDSKGILQLEALCWYLDAGNRIHWWNAAHFTCLIESLNYEFMVWISYCDFTVNQKHGHVEHYWMWDNILAQGEQKHI